MHQTWRLTIQIYLKLKLINRGEMHYLTMISDRPDMIFRVEFLIRSIKRFCPQPAVFSVVVNGERQSPLGTSLSLSKGRINNKYISDNAEVIHCPYHWSIPAPSRWFVEPKMDNCVFIDADIMACQDLSPLYNLDKEVFHGVTAFRQTMTDDEWSYIGMNHQELVHYFNFGLLVVPSRLMRDIGNRMLRNVPMIMNVFRKHQYFAGQIALAYTLKEIGVKRNALDQKFNWYDMLPPPPDMQDILLLHYIINKSSVESWAKMRNISPGNEYAKLIVQMGKRLNPKIYL